MARTGRPTLLSDEVHAKIIEGIHPGGLYPETAAAMAGIERLTFLRWLREGRKDPEGRYGDFVRDVDLALEHAEAADTQAHLKIAHDKTDTKVVCPSCSESFFASVPSNVQLTALQWRMQRKYGNRWGEKQTVVVEQKAQSAVEEILDAVKPHMTPDAYAEFLDALAAAMGEQGVAGDEAGGSAH